MNTWKNVKNYYQRNSRVNYDDISLLLRKTENQQNTDKDGESGYLQLLVAWNVGTTLLKSKMAHLSPPVNPRISNNDQIVCISQ